MPNAMHRKKLGDTIISLLYLTYVNLVHKNCLLGYEREELLMIIAAQSALSAIYSRWHAPAIDQAGAVQNHLSSIYSLHIIRFKYIESIRGS
jgi:hypothetical protein